MVRGFVVDGKLTAAVNSDIRAKELRIRCSKASATSAGETRSRKRRKAYPTTPAMRSKRQARPVSGLARRLYERWAISYPARSHKPFGSDRRTRSRSCSHSPSGKKSAANASLGKRGFRSCQRNSNRTLYASQSFRCTPSALPTAKPLCRQRDRAAD